MTKIEVEPNENLQSPFLVKCHLFFKRSDPNILDELYRLITTMDDPRSIQFKREDHKVFIPVIHCDHWTLYAFNMCDKRLSILDSLPDASEGGEDPFKRHEEIRKKYMDTMELRKEFLACILSIKNNDALMPPNVSEWIGKLPG
uniref:Ubiquitin-like protease family profile domain-containing protein n=1 Tax=Leersia perrieri TaxID=77586 RepID=A0A0D9XC62_9ORYZ